MVRLTTVYCTFRIRHPAREMIAFSCRSFDGGFDRVGHGLECLETKVRAMVPCPTLACRTTVTMLLLFQVVRPPLPARSDSSSRRYGREYICSTVVL